ncbi:delta 9 acyl-lipid fatty acid desaturase [Rhodopirellula baltica SH28]|uniref:Delta 9 acyl-lipid fatty acid desaturase n=3 Tax=Rhodopirellula baltica TaxID=265606 RepID=Q7UWH4_RHOBA|nr:delta 9 acyl-lipid fatty acid desaturase [Rhodopirellula baltica SH28]CAD72389.1 delta 9 acyl-lipid fatty acid desaturase [Rhodopirellula baltica SH 1]
MGHEFQFTLVLTMSTSEAPAPPESAKRDKLVCDESNDYGSGAVPTEAMAVGETGIDPQRLPRPEETQPLRIMWQYVIVLSLVHLVALAAFVPAWFSYLFTWSGLIAGIAGHFIFGMFGITIGYHRLLTHRGFKCPKWMEHTLAILGMCNLQDSPARWVAIHRMHHQHSDHQPDPHSPLVNFLWGHMGWVVCRHKDLDKTSHYERYVRDLLRDRFYLKLERKDGWFFVFLIHGIIISLIGGAVGYAVSGGDWAVAYRYLLSWTVWAVAIRTVFVLHGTWSVNSLSHVFGYRNYDTRDHSTNNWLVALISHGEGWHNNHHATPRSARHGHKWYEFDMSWGIIRVWEMMGLITDVQRPTKASVAGK